LKGAAATALYGSQGGNGAVIITTKSGKQGGSKGYFEVSHTLTIDQFVNNYDMQKQYGGGSFGYDGAVLGNDPEYANIDTCKREIKTLVQDKKNIDKKLRTKIQMIFQDPIASLDPRMTVRDIIAEGLIINGMKDKEEIDNKVYKILELVGLVKEHASRYPHEFSGGQKQRIGVARAVIMEPDLIIADEPVSALDVSIQAQVINLLNDLRRELGLTILFIAHDLSVVKYFSDRIGVMYFGKMVELAPADELFRNPLHPYTRSLLSAIPLPDPMYEKKRQRIVYNPLASHDYSKEGPTMREVRPGHFVYCNSEEFKKYQKEIK
jgi:TonB-dependent SusC/RagA subfamily outer membrane receptor